VDKNEPSKIHRKRYVQLLKMLSDERKPQQSYVHVLDQLEGVERELYRLGQHEWMEKTSKRYTKFEQ